MGIGKTGQGERVEILSGVAREGFPESKGIKVKGPVEGPYPLPSSFVFLFKLFAWGCEIERWLSLRGGREGTGERMLCECDLYHVVSFRRKGGIGVQDRQAHTPWDADPYLGGASAEDTLCDEGTIIAPLCPSLPLPASRDVLRLASAKSDKLRGPWTSLSYKCSRGGSSCGPRRRLLYE